MKIIRLTAENVKRISAVEIEPDGNLVVVGGRNGQGKTSTLDAIWYALGGKGAQPDEPIRRGAKKGRVQLDLGDIVVTRTFTPSGGTLKVEGTDGHTFRSPQSMLDDLVGRLSFDPLAFTRMSPREQYETLKGVLGVDTTEIDDARKAAYEARRVVNADAKRAKASIPNVSIPEGTPDEEVSARDILDRIDEATRVNNANAHDRAKAKAHRSKADRLRDEVRAAAKRYHELKRQMDEAEKKAAAAEEAVSDLEDVNIDAISGELKFVEETNRMVRLKKQVIEARSRERELREKSAKLTRVIEEADARKAAMIEGASPPVEGLGLGDGVVTLDGIPFDQASGAEQLRVSAALGLAANPKLKVLLIRDGSLLDDDSMSLLSGLAEDHDAQIWIERVGKGEDVTVVIEDGEVER